MGKPQNTEQKEQKKKLLIYLRVTLFFFYFVLLLDILLAFPLKSGSPSYYCLPAVVNEIRGNACCFLVFLFSFSFFLVVVVFEHNKKRKRKRKTWKAFPTLKKTVQIFFIIRWFSSTYSFSPNNADTKSHNLFFL